MDALSTAGDVERVCDRDGRRTTGRRKDGLRNRYMSQSELRVVAATERNRPLVRGCESSCLSVGLLTVVDVAGVQAPIGERATGRQSLTSAAYGRRVVQRATRMACNEPSRTRELGLGEG
jgi:hypothetical protein